MENIAKGLVVLSALSFVPAVVAGLMGGALMGFTAESFFRACSNLALVAIAVMMMGKVHSSTPTSGV